MISVKLFHSRGVRQLVLCPVGLLLSGAGALVLVLPTLGVLVVPPPPDSIDVRPLEGSSVSGLCLRGVLCNHVYGRVCFAPSRHKGRILLLAGSNSAFGWHRFTDHGFCPGSSPALMSESAPKPRLQALLARIRATIAGFRCHKNIRGLLLDLDRLRALGARPDLLAAWEFGRSFEPSADIPREFRNHPSLEDNPEWAEREWDRLAAMGKVSFFPMGAPKPLQLNVNPCALILKPREGVADVAEVWERFKARLILDLKRGRVNMRVPPVSVSYGSAELAISRMSVGDFLFVVDLQDAFFNWKVLPEDSFLLGFYSSRRQQYGKYDYFPFGLAPSPGVNDESVKELLRLLEAHTGVVLTDFVDDLLGGASSLDDAWEALDRTVDFLLSVGVPVSAKPTGIRPPCQQQTWIGWVFDTRPGVSSVSVTSSKCGKCRGLAAETLELDNKRELRANLLASTAGLASHIAEIYPQARRRLHPIWADLNAAGVYALWARNSHAKPLVALSELSRRNLHWLIEALQVPPSRPLHCHGGQLSSWGARSPEFLDWANLAARGEINVIETDAAKLSGWSYHLTGTGKVVSGTWPLGFATNEDQDNADHINYKELWVVNQCLEQEGPHLRGWRLLFRIDNAAAVHYVNVRYGRVSSLESLAVRLEALEREWQCWALALHLRGVHNPIADLGSRDADFATRWAADKFREARLRPDLFSEIQDRCSVVFSLVLFSDRAGANALAPAWRSPELSAFEDVLTGHVVWAHPPRNLLFAVLKHLQSVLQDDPSIKIVVLAPEDCSAPWFRPNLLRNWYRIRSWNAGSDLFRWLEGSGSNHRWRKGPRSDLRYNVLQSWKPGSR